MKVGDKVKIKDEVELPEWVKNLVLSKPNGIIHKVYSDKCDVRTSHGLWLIDKKFLEVKK
jgi:hypothetical protein